MGENPSAGQSVDLALPSADFAFNGEFRVVSFGPAEPYVIVDADQRSVATLAQSLGGEARTRTEAWEFEAERRDSSWAVVARALSEEVEAGRVVEGWIPNTHKLWIAPDTNCRLSANPISGNWTLRRGRERVARLTQTALGPSSLIGPRFIGPRFPAAIIHTFEGMLDTAGLGLAILLALEMVKIDASIPRVDTPSGR